MSRTEGHKSMCHEEIKRTGTKICPKTGRVVQSKLKPVGWWLKLPVQELMRKIWQSSHFFGLKMGAVLKVTTPAVVPTSTMIHSLILKILLNYRVIGVNAYPLNDPEN